MRRSEDEIGIKGSENELRYKRAEIDSCEWGEKEEKVLQRVRVRSPPTFPESLIEPQFCLEHLTNERSSLLIVECGPVSARENAQHRPEHCNQANNEESECRPVNELAARLVLEDGQQTQADNQCSGNIALRVPNVTCSSRLQEEQAEEDDDLGNDASLVRDCVDTEGLEASYEEEDDDESMVKAEGEVDEDSISEVACSVVNLE